MLGEDCGQALGVRAIRVAGEDAVEVEDIERGATGVRLHRERIADGHDPQRPDEVRHGRLLEDAVKSLSAPGSLVAVHPGRNGDHGFRAPDGSDAEVQRPGGRAARERVVPPHHVLAKICRGHEGVLSSGKVTQRCSRCESATALMISWTFAFWAKLPW